MNAKMIKRVLSFVLVFAMLCSLAMTSGFSIFAEEASGVAKIGDTTYATLAEAVKAVEKGTTATPTTITLLKDQTISSIMVGHSYAQNIIIDLNEHTLSSSGKALVAFRSGTTLTLKNGTVSGNATGGTVQATYGGTLVLGDDLTVKGAGGSATLVTVDDGTVEISAKNGVEFVGGKLDFKPTTTDKSVINVAASIDRTYFGSLADALAAAKDGETVKLFADVSASEILVINKAITLDGNNKTLTSTAARAINVEVEGNVIIKDLTINASGERAINVINKAVNITIDNVTATAKNYALMMATSATGANATVTNSNLTGLNTVNVASANSTVVIEDTMIINVDANPNENYAAIAVYSTAANTVITVKGGKVVVADDSYASYVAADTATVTFEGTENADNDDVAKLVAMIGDAGFFSLKDAIEYAKSGDTIKLVADINVDVDDLVVFDNDYRSFFVVEGKTITVDLNGKTIYADVSDYKETAMIVGVFTTAKNGHLTLTGDGEVKGYSGATEADAWLDPAKGTYDYNYKFYSLLVNYDDDCSITVNGGKYNLDYAGDSLVYTSCNEGVVVNGGEFRLGNLGGIRNGMPWIFNARGQNVRHVVVNGGSFKADIVHQYYPFEVSMSHELALKYENGMYNVVKAVAYVNEQEFSGAWYTNNVGYATLAEAIEAVDDIKTARNGKKSAQEIVTLLCDASGAGVKINKDVIIDFGGFTYTLTEAVGSAGTESNGFQLLRDNKITFKNGKLTVADDCANKFYILIQNYSDLTITDMELDGTYLDKWSNTNYSDSYVVSNNSGNVLINGKTVITANDDGIYAYAFDAYDDPAYTSPVVTVADDVEYTGIIDSADSEKIDGATVYYAVKQ